MEHQSRDVASGHDSEHSEVASGHDGELLPEQHAEEPSSDLASSEAMYRILSFFQELDLPDFVRLMSEFEAAATAYRHGDPAALTRMLNGIAVDSMLAARDPDDLRRAKKEVEEQLSNHGPIGNARKYLTERRRGAA
ncbi:MAG: hypothetical protein ACJ74O_11280 [Frankiaceae bacterium]